MSILDRVMADADAVKLALEHDVHTAVSYLREWYNRVHGAEVEVNQDWHWVVTKIKNDAVAALTPTPAAVTGEANAPTSNESNVLTTPPAPDSTASTTPTGTSGSAPDPASAQPPSEPPVADPATTATPAV